MIKDFNYYINLPYTIEVKQDTSDPDKPVWFAQVRELPGCMTEADTWEDVHEMIHDAMAGWTSVRLQKGLAIAEPRPDLEYSGKFNVRLPKSLHRNIVMIAKREGVSSGSFVSVVLGQAVEREGST